MSGHVCSSANNVTVERTVDQRWRNQQDIVAVARVNSHPRIFLRDPREDDLSQEETRLTQTILRELEVERTGKGAETS